METKYNCTISSEIPNTYEAADGTTKTYTSKQEIKWDRCTEGEMLSLIHLIREDMTLTVEACNDEES